MTISGTIRNGVVVLDEASPVPEGTRVEVVVTRSEPNEPTLKGLLKFAGLAKDMPADFAAQHDHYIHGTPKK